MIGDLAVLDPHDVDRFEVDLAVSWSDAEKRPFMGAVVVLNVVTRSPSASCQWIFA
jgi:hypothetical protein